MTMPRIQNTNKNKRYCVPCVPSCVPLNNNGTQTQALSNIAFNTFVYHVYDFLACAHVRIFSFLLSSLVLCLFFNFFSALKKFSCARKSYLNGTHGTQINVSIENKGFPVFTISKNSKHNGTHGKHSLKKEF